VVLWLCNSDVIYLPSFCCKINLYKESHLLVFGKLMSYIFKQSVAPTQQLSNVLFGILSPEEIMEMSVVKIEHEQLYEGKEPKIGGLADPRMGCIEKNMECYTCGETVDTCPGHFGHIELETPVYHIGFIKIVKKILECVCHKCYRFRFLPTDSKYSKVVHAKDKFKTAWNHAKAKDVCDFCETRLYPIRRTGIELYSDPRKFDKKMNKIPIPASEARRILERISDETCIFLGLDPVNARPEWMIITVMAVPPQCVRPSIHMDFNGRGEDDLTSMLAQIVKYNNRIKRHENTRASTNDDKEQLQIHVTSYIDNEVSGVPPTLQKGGRLNKSITARLKGKEGRMRGHLMGKRVDYSARTVITGDPNLSIEEVGVPKSIAKNLTFPEKVSRWNIEQLQKLVLNGPVYPGAKFVIRENGTRILLSPNRNRPIILKYGDIVERHMVDDDWVIFNRQPTLHKMSMMAHKVRVLDYSTFRLNVNVCAPYNADFDGDEMNLHMPQTLTSKAELLELSKVSTNIVSPQANKPVIGLVQDALCGIRKFTKRDTFLSVSDMMNIVLWIKDWDGILPQPAIRKPVPLWTGKQVLSMLLPKIDMQGFHSAHSKFEEDFKQAFPDQEKIFQRTNPYDTKVLIDDGELLAGILCKKTVGSSAGGVVHIIWVDYGAEAARDFIDNTAKVVNHWLCHHGFSVGIGDAIMSKKGVELVHEHVSEQLQKVETVLDMHRKGLLIPKGAFTVDETKEDKVQLLLAKARDGAGKLAKRNLCKDNNILQMVEAGSKGSDLNICQISANVGQQIVEGKRLPLGFKGRTLPHYTRFDDSPESRGFVRNSFIVGLTPQEVFFHAMGGREGLIDTAIKTATSGYTQRRLIKALEDISVKYDGTVRNSRNNVVQFLYGEDGFDGTAIENQVFPTMMLSDEEFRQRYFVFEEEFTVLQNDRQFLRETMRMAEDRWPLPLNLKRIIERSKKVHPSKDGEMLTCEKVFKSVSELRGKLKPAAWTHPSMLFGILLQSMLASKQVIEHHRLSRAAFERVLSTVEQRYRAGLVHPGECVGVIAAQSIGEPATQMTLNSVHYDTEMLLKVDGKLVRQSIGDYVEGIFADAIEEDIEHHPNDTHLAWIKDQKVEVISTDEDGKLDWRIVEAVTKHPVINEDGTNTLLKVSLRSGRHVVATKGESFLKRIDGKILPVKGSDLNVGDFLPVSRKLITDESLTYLDVSQFLPKEKWIYMSEVEIALECKLTQGKTWWHKCHTKLFTLPYSRSDTFLVGCGREEHTKSNRMEKMKKRAEKFPRLPNCIYPLHQTEFSSHIPEKIELDREFGWFCGAYLAEGHCTVHAVLISNNDNTFNERLYAFCRRWDLRYHIDEGPKNGGWSKTIRIHNMVLAQLIPHIFGRGSANKRVHVELLRAPNEFLIGLISGYFDGDGAINGNGVSAASISKNLLEDIRQILSKFAIQSKLRGQSDHALETQRKRYPNSSRLWNVILTINESIKFARIFDLTVPHKVAQLRAFALKTMGKGVKDVIPDVTINGVHHRKILRSEVEVAEVDKELYYDEIVTIEEVANENPYVYDLTVKKTRYFSTYSGVNCFDTFHLAGRGNKAVTTGIPRLTELINAVKNLKTPSMTIYLDEEHRFDKLYAKKVKVNIEHTVLLDLLGGNQLEIHYDPEYTDSAIEEDRVWMDIANAIPNDDLPMPEQLQPWVMRLIFSRSSLVERDLSLAYVADKLLETFDGELFIQHSDDNANVPSMHIRIFKDDDFVETEDITPCQEFMEMASIDFLGNVTIAGVPGIDKAFISQKQCSLYDEETGKLDGSKKEWIIETDGINMKDCLKVPGVDKTRIFCNDPQEMMSMFGVELARETLVEEIRAVIEAGGSSINHRHLSLLCDFMTNRGQIMSITRHGINKSDAGPLMKCTFEQTVDILLDAAVHGDQDNIKGVAENIMLGRVANIGTGMMDLLLNEEMLETLPDARALDLIEPKFDIEDGKVTRVERFKRAEGPVTVEELDEFYSLPSGLGSKVQNENGNVASKIVERNPGTLVYNPLRPSYLK
jgi:DNA-directed RNA polymerase beta' subunit